MARSAKRRLGLLCAAWCVGVGAPAFAQTGASSNVLIAEQTAERVSYTLGDWQPLVGSGGVGGALGAMTHTQRFREDVLILQAGPRRDARLRLVLTRRQGRRLLRRVVEVEAEGVAVGLGMYEGEPTPRPRWVFAAGAVRMRVDTGTGDRMEGELVVEAERVWLDVLHEDAEAEQATVRLRSGATGGLIGTPVVRAERVRVEGLRRVVAERAEFTTCDFGEPHYALRARRLTVEALGLEEERGPVLPALVERSQEGSDALQRESQAPREIDLEDVELEVFGERRLTLPFPMWRTNWPLPRVRVGQSSRLGAFGVVELDVDLAEWQTGIGRLRLSGETGAEVYSQRGEGGSLGLRWSRSGEGGGGRGALRGFGLRDRGEEDRVGTPVETEGRYWLRGVIREQLGDLEVDAEASKQSDAGVLLEYFRGVQQTEKEQETYLHLRYRRDALALRGIGRVRLNDFQEQVERLPEVRLDWTHVPLGTDPRWGGLYLDLGASGGLLRRRFADGDPRRDTEAARGDLRAELSWAHTLGPVAVRGWAATRYTAWSAQQGTSQGVERWLGETGWNASLTLWNRYRTPLGIVRHEVIPELGTQHRFGVEVPPERLLQFDPEVEGLRATDFLFVRTRTRLLSVSEGIRRPVVDLAVEARYFPRDRGADRARRWGSLFGDLRLFPTTWLRLRVRAEHDLNRNRLIDLDVTASARVREGWQVLAGYRDLEGLARAVNWGVRWRLTESWTVEAEQQYDFLTREFLYHRGRLVRQFHRFAVEVTASFDPQQDDVSVSASISLQPVWGDEADPFADDRYRGLYGSGSGRASVDSP